MPTRSKPLAWLHGEIKSPPFSDEARVETGVLLRQLQEGHTLALPLAQYKALSKRRRSR